LALRYGWGAPTAPRPTQAWNSDQPSVVWSDLHEPKKKIGRKTKSNSRGDLILGQTKIEGARSRSAMNDEVADRADNAAVPNDYRQLRACQRCHLVLPARQFEK